MSSSRRLATLALLLAAGCQSRTILPREDISGRVVTETPLGPQIAFGVIAAVILGGALLTITRRNAVSAVMALVATFFGLAALYTLLSAHFLAAIQVLVYAGAIMTLFVFVVMLLNREEMQRLAPRGVVTRAFGLALAAGMMVWVGVFLRGPRGEKLDLPPEGFGSVKGVGRVLFQEYLFPFEAISILLLIAVIAAVVVARIPRRRAVAEQATGESGGTAHAPPAPAASERGHS
jgi:NADH-quinone oxidoreductase subunit J